MANINIVSYNSTGLGQDKVVYIREFMQEHKPDFMLLQETWRISSTLHVLGNIHKEYLWHGVCGVDDKENLLCGRPPGGVAILWKKSLANIVTKVKMAGNHRRICSVMVHLGNVKLLVMSVYMPNDNYKQTMVEEEFLEICDQIECVILEQKPDFYIIGGDYNVDFRRDNAHSRWMEHFMESNDLFNTWKLPFVIPEDTFIMPNNTSKSRIDYLACSTNLEYNVVSLKAHKDPTNLSWHRPISIVVAFDQEDVHRECVAEDLSSGTQNPRVAWNKVSEKHIGQYKARLDRKLMQCGIPQAAYCQDIRCKDPSHRDQITSWCEDLSNSCLGIGQECLPKCKRRCSSKPDWSEEAQPFKEASQRWHSMWIEQGEPEHGETYERMRDAKRQYAYATRRLKRRERHRRNEKMAEAISTNRSRDFWKEVKKVNQGRHDPPNIDGVRDNKEIAELFKSKYEELFNSNPSMKKNLDTIEVFIEENIGNSDFVDLIVTEEQVVKAVHMLKHGKADGDKGVMSDHVINGPRRLFTLLSLLLSTARRHGHMPDEMLLATISSIPKDKCGDICSSENYRGIALSSCLSKLNDIIIMNQYAEKIATTDMQYSFKAEHGTTMCTMVFKEVSKYYIQNGNEIYASFIDASKAFDRVRHDMLFLLLIERGIPAVIVRSLFDSYKRQKMRTTWNGYHSEVFGTENGIKQGSIISPVLFTVYMDKLLCTLEESGYGCNIGSFYFGSMGYADDLKLLCPSAYGLQQMIIICENYGDEYGVKYNPVKSVNMMLTNKEGLDPPRIMMKGQEMKWVNKVKDLGNIVRHDLRETDEIMHKKRDFIGRVNNMNVNFRRAPDSILRTIFNGQCAHLYGCEAWNHYDSSIGSFYTTWNKSVRNILNLPYRTHTRFLSQMLKTSHVEDQVLNRFYKMFLTMVNGPNDRVSFLARSMAHKVRSICGRSIRTIAERYEIDSDSLMKGMHLKKFHSNSLNDADQRNVDFIMEIRSVFKYECSVPGFTHNELKDIMEFLCCD